MEQETEKTKERTGYLDALRAVSICAVILVHLSATGYQIAPEGSSARAICWCYDLLSRFAVPVFVMISGAIFLNPDRTVTFKTLLRRYIPRLLRTFLLWSMGFALLQSAGEQPLFSAAYWLSVLRKTVTGHYHMWYLYMIMGLYLAVPFLRPLAANEKLLKQFILISFLLGSVPQLLYLIPAAGAVIREVVERADISFFAGYAGYFCLGYYLHSAQIPKRSVVALAALAVVLMTAMAVLGVQAGLTEPLLREKMPHIFVYSAAVFLIFKEYAGRIRRSAALHKLIEKLAFCSLGMYLVHPAVNFILRAFGLYALTFPPLLCIPFCGILVFVISFAIAALMKKCPLLKRLV